MGAAESTAADDAAPASGLEGISGWKILYVAEGSPCDQLGLVPYFDLITHCNQTALTQAENSLVSHLHPHVPITLTVLSLSTRKSRPVIVTPFRGWGGEGLLGLMIRYEALETVEMECIHVLEIYPSSPAYDAGLQAYSDYLLGSSKLAFKGWDQLDFWLNTQDRVNSSIMVFNSSTWRVREVWITPNSRWGGKGSLGADVAQGFVHRLPVFDSTQPVRMDKRSRLRRGKRTESGLRYEEDQLMLNLVIGGGADDDVNLLSIRVRGKEEYQHKAPTQLPATATPRQIQRPDRHQAHAHGEHGHSHGGADHGHSPSHGPSNAHAHAHNPAPSQAAAVQEQKTQETKAHGQEKHRHAHSHEDGGHGHQHGPAVTSASKPVVNTADAAVQTKQASSNTGKKPLPAQLPRSSRESSPAFAAVNTSATTTNAPPTNSSTASNSTSPRQPSPSASSSAGPPPFPSLAPSTTMQQNTSQSASNSHGHSHSEHGHSHSHGVHGHSHSHGHSDA